MSAHDWELIPGYTTMWRCLRCGARGGSSRPGEPPGRFYSVDHQGWAAHSLSHSGLGAHGCDEYVAFTVMTS